METTQKIDILLATYNGEKYIKEQLDSILNQTYKNIRILINDDASTDNTANIIREYEKMYPHIIKPIYQTINQYKLGIGISKTFLYPKAKGEYIALCEGDDYWTDKNKLQIQIDYMKKHPNCVMTCHAYNFIYPNQRIKEIKFGQNDFDATPDLIINHSYSFQTATKVIKKEILLTMPILLPNLSIGDFPQILFAMTKGDIHYINKNMSNYRFSTENSWTSKQEINKANYINHKKKMIKYYNLFNSFTSFKYKNEINKKIDFTNYSIALATNNYRMARKCNYYKESNVKQKLKIIIGILFPKIIKFLSIFKSKFLK